MEVRNIGEGGSSGKPLKMKKTSRGLECAALSANFSFKVQSYSLISGKIPNMEKQRYSTCTA